jgi:hypothetical protein
MAHKVRRQFWRGSYLKTEDHWFGSAEEAVEFAKHHDSAKVYDENEELVYSKSDSDKSTTYA